jgi:hypothetical protein
MDALRGSHGRTDGPHEFFVGFGFVAHAFHLISFDF